jgi:glucose/arabinose dehydrogenase
MQNIGKKKSRHHFVVGLISLTVLFLLAACNLIPASQIITPSVPVTTTREPSTPASFSPITTGATSSSTTDSPLLTPSSTLTATQTHLEALSLPNPENFFWKPVASGLSQPIGITYTSSEEDRIYIVEQVGIVSIIDRRSFLPEPFLDIQSRVNSQGSEQGLLGLAFHPQYPQVPFIFVNYTDLKGNTVISRFMVTGGEPAQADAGSEKILLRVDQPFSNHNGGEVVFGPDDYLYLGLGDGGSAGDPRGNAQSTNTLLGKILRIDVNQGDPYSIPADNPFANAGGKPELWAYGLRNPWRFSFDRQTGALYIGDVGQNSWEEVDYLPAGSPGGFNFGWNYYEGLHPYQGTPTAGEQFVQPVFEYGHDQGCSIIGGVVYRGMQLSDWRGVYLFGDYCSGIVWGMYLQPDGNWQVQRMFETNARITSFGEDAAGEVYLADHGGNIFVLARKP